MEKYVVFVKEPAVAFNRYIVEAENKEEAIRLAKEGKAGEPDVIEAEVKDPNSAEFVGFEYALVDNYDGDFDAQYPDYPHGDDEDEYEDEDA